MRPIVRADAEPQATTLLGRGVAIVSETWKWDTKLVFYASLYVLAFLAIAILVGTRPLGLVPDDFTNLAYFQNSDWFQFLDKLEVEGFSWILEESFWQLLVYVLSLFIDPEFAFRLMMFSSILMYSWAFRKAPASALLFVLFSFIVFPSMLGQLYFNQVRQGLAISIFLVFLSLGDWGYFVGAAVAGLVHTSQLTLLPIYVKSTKQFAISVAVVLVVGVFLAAGMLEFFLGNLELGRRGSQYAFESPLNLRYALSAVPLYFGILGFVWYEHARLKQPPEPILFRVSIFCFVCFIIAYGSEAGGRLFYLLDAMVVWTLCRFWRGRVPLGAWLWACAQLVLGGYMSLVDNFVVETPWGRLGILFSSW